MDRPSRALLLPIYAYAYCSTPIWISTVLTCYPRTTRPPACRPRSPILLTAPIRQSNRAHGAALLAKLESVSAAAGGARVDLVTHSMGGLVAKFLLAQYPAAFQRLVGWYCVSK